MQKSPMYRSSRAAIALMSVAAAMPVAITVVNAGEGVGSPHFSALAEKEIVRRQNDVAEADRLLGEARAAYQKRDYQLAFDKCTIAYGKLPKSATSLDDRRAAVTAQLADASVALAQQFRRQGGDAKKGDKGKYEDARTLLEDVLEKDPGNIAAKREIGFLDDPIRTNPGLDYKHTQDVDTVRRSLYTAEGFYNLGKFDKAKEEYEKVLRVDPYNSAARRGMESVAGAKSRYYRAAYDQTRAELLAEVDKAWELSVPADTPVGGIAGPGRTTVSSGVAYINEKLRRIIIPSIAFDDITVEEAVDFLRLRAAELDLLEPDPAHKGVNFLIRKPQAAAGADAAVDAAPVEGALGGGGSPGAIRIKSLRLTNIPLGQALKYICDQTNLRSKVDDFAVTLVPRTETGNEMFTRTFRVLPGFYETLASGAGDEGGAATAVDPFAGGAAAGAEKKGITARKPIIELLKKIATFGEGSTATLGSSGLLVTNTSAELDKIEQFVEANSNSQPKQVKITTKFVEVTQDNNDELSFDWLVTPFGLSSNTAANTLFGSGGTVGSGQARSGADLINPVNGVSIPGIPSNPVSNVDNLMTNGNRSGTGAINGNSIDSLLNNPLRTSSASKVAPGIAAVTGLFSGGQVQLIMRGLAQKKGADLMTAPSVTAKSGQKATIQIIREFIYATEYAPPQLPQSGGGNGGGGGGNGGNGAAAAMIAAPSTPSAWETRNTGVTLEIEPTVQTDNYVIDVRFVPEIVEFEGFINYGSPIKSPSVDVFGNPTTVILTDNRIEMPVFSTRRVNTSLSIYDGYTVAVGGLIREDVQNVQDSLPIFGSLPIIGRLFQSKAEKRLKSNLIIFVTAQIIDATGRPLRGSEPNTPPAGEALPSAPGEVLPPLQ
ncbi:MAG: type II and III secretion system protein [Verrucomicrobia bacterium]|nr:MAG: type II and III secretion system protein [Verrucomicrobiota bacterium]